MKYNKANSHSCDPFYEAQENHNLIGVANIFLECLFHDVKLQYAVPIISQQGEVTTRRPRRRIFSPLRQRLDVAVSRLGGRSPARGAAAGQRSRAGTPVRRRRLVGELQREQLLRGDGHQRRDRPHGQEAHVQGRSLDCACVIVCLGLGSPACWNLSAASHVLQRATSLPHSSEKTQFFCLPLV